MNFKKNKIFNLIFFIFITNISISLAHDSFNGGCMDHCEKSFKVGNVEKKLKKIENKNQIKDNYSCLSKSLCRG